MKRLFFLSISIFLFCSISAQNIGSTHSNNDTVNSIQHKNRISGYVSINYGIGTPLGKFGTYETAPNGTGSGLAYENGYGYATQNNMWGITAGILIKKIGLYIIGKVNYNLFGFDMNQYLKTAGQSPFGNTTYYPISHTNYMIYSYMSGISSNIGTGNITLHFSLLFGAQSCTTPDIKYLGYYPYTRYSGATGMWEIESTTGLHACVDIGASIAYTFAKKIMLLAGFDFLLAPGAHFSTNGQAGVPTFSNYVFPLSVSTSNISMGLGYKF